MVKRTKIVEPVNIESNFELDELFFSKTDLTGNILTGNNVFIRISQYTKEELIGKPHNIIRHPDMPRVVFKLLWDYIKAGKTITAYVKNMTKEGKYYWVLATVFPIHNGYLSVRFKPYSDYFKIIPDLYKSLLTAEESNGMNASLDLLNQTLQAKGFNDYDSFMSKMIVEELNVRQKLLQSSKDSLEPRESITNSKQLNHKGKDLVELLAEISKHCQHVNNVFNQLFNEFECLLKVEGITNDNTDLVLKFSDLISVLALNSSIETYRLGEHGSALSVISKSIKRDSEEIENYAYSVSKHSKEISIQAKQLGLLTSTSRIQSQMINFFVGELLEEACQREIADNELIEMHENIILLVDNFLKSFSQVSNILTPLQSRVKEISAFIEMINKIIRDLERSDVLGSIEASRIGEIGMKFSIVFNQMRESTVVTRDRLLAFDKYLINATQTINIIVNSNLDILQSVEQIKLSTSRIINIGSDKSEIKENACI